MIGELMDYLSTGVLYEPVFFMKQLGTNDLAK